MVDHSLALAAGQIQEQIDGLRTLITELRPAALDQFGLKPALESLLTRLGTVEGLDVTGELTLAPRRLDPELETTIYRFVQEALTNVAKHARADHVHVRLTAEPTPSRSRSPTTAAASTPTAQRRLRPTRHARTRRTLRRRHAGGDLRHRHHHPSHDSRRRVVLRAACGLPRMARAPPAATIGAMPTPRPIHVLPHALGQPPLDVLIAGGGPAAIEAALTPAPAGREHGRHDHPGSRHRVHVSPAERPRAVRGRNGAGVSARPHRRRRGLHARARDARERRCRRPRRPHARRRADPAMTCCSSPRARVAMPPLPGMTAFTGSAADEEAVHGLVQDVEGGYTRRVAFVVPRRQQLAAAAVRAGADARRRARSRCASSSSCTSSPRSPRRSRCSAPRPRARSRELLGDRRNHPAHRVPVDRLERGRAVPRPGTDALDVLRVITLPHFEGPAIAGLPRTPRASSSPTSRPRDGHPGRLCGRRRHGVRRQAGRHRLPAGRRGGRAHRRARRRRREPPSRSPRCSAACC